MLSPDVSQRIEMSPDKMILQIFDIFSHEFSPFSTQLSFEA